MANVQPSLRSAALLGALVCFAQLGCSSASAATPEDRDLESLKHAVAGFHDLSAAQRAGYTVVVGDPTDGHTCLSDPQAGGMGLHYLDKALVDDTVIETRPEILIYEPQRDGSLDFPAVGVARVGGPKQSGWHVRDVQPRRHVQVRAVVRSPR